MTSQRGDDGGEESASLGKGVSSFSLSLVVDAVFSISLVAAL